MFRSLLLLCTLGALALPGGVVRAETAHDVKPGREAQKRAHEIEKLEKKYSRRLADCTRGQTAACADANQISGLIETLRAER